MWYLLKRIAAWCPSTWQLNSLLRIVLGHIRYPRLHHIHIVCATRKEIDKFWQESPLGQSLHCITLPPNISVHIFPSNSRGLPSVYNDALTGLQEDSIALFVHDDVWLTDPRWPEKVRLGLERFDILGVAGTQRRSRRQPTWLFREFKAGKFIGDDPYWSGEIYHGASPPGQCTVYGPAPRYCELLDGVFLACRVSSLRKHRILFDTLFSFHMYDMDFCRTARRNGLLIGTWPIHMVHQSNGNFGSTLWAEALRLYQKKYWLFP